MLCSCVERAECLCLFILFDYFLFYFCWIVFFVLFFFFQAEDGIRDHCVTGVQTCALPISRPAARCARARGARRRASPAGRSSRPGSGASRRRRAATCRCPARRRPGSARAGSQIGRASCRERVWMSVVGGLLEGKMVRGELE